MKLNEKKDTNEKIEISVSKLLNETTQRNNEHIHKELYTKTCKTVLPWTYKDLCISYIKKVVRALRLCKKCDLVCILQFHTKIIRTESVRTIKET